MQKNTVSFTLVVILAARLFSSCIYADVIDDNLNQTHDYLSYYENPYKLTRGSIVGIDGYGGEYAVAWANGAAARYTEEEILIDVFGTGNSDATGIAYVTQGAGIQGDIAVSRLAGFLTYDFEGNELQGYGIISPYDVRDIDIELGRVWVGQTGNFGYRDPVTYSVHEMLTGQIGSVMAVNLIESEIDRLHTDGGAGSFVKKFNPDLSFMPATISTDYIAHEGFALTNEYLLLVVDDFVVKYENPYKGYTEPVPEPASVLLLGVGIVISGIGRKKKHR